MWHLCYIYLFAFTGILSLLLTRLLIGFALKRGVVDLPAERKIHAVPVPLLGGIAIYLSFTISVVAHLGFTRLLLSMHEGAGFMPSGLIELLRGMPAVWQKLRVVLFGGTAMVLLGLLDDMKSLNARTKLLIQVFSATMLVVFGIRITLFMGNIYVGALITVLWVVGITNAFNLLDNMDGLSAGVALIATLLFFITAVKQGSIFVSAILIVFAGSLLGFLRYNFNPAKIFMGDTGSLFIGYVLSSLTMLNTYYTEGLPTFFPVLMPVIILAVPVFDTASVVFIRLKNRESIFKPDRRHFSHRLVNLGFTHRQAVMLVYLVSFCTGVGAILLRQVNITGAIIILAQTAAVFAIIVALEIAGAKIACGNNSDEKK